MSNNNFGTPVDLPIVDERRSASPSMSIWISRVHNAASALYQSGSTAQRPTTLLWVGRPFFDTTLNKPVWVASVRPTVWRDAAGAVV